jgi:integrase
MSDNSTQATRSRKARKSLTAKLQPYAGFPLSAHAAGSWQKKILGRVFYFGPWGRRINGKLEPLPGDAGSKAALKLYEQQRDALHSGRVPQIASDQVTLRDLCNAFLNAKLRRQAAGEMTVRSFADYREVTDLLIREFGADRPIGDLGPNDFEALRDTFAKRWGPTRLGNVIGRTRSIFKYAIGSELIDKQVRFGDEFVKPKKSVFRKHRAKRVEKMFEPAELREMLKHAQPQLRAMIFLGLNCGLGNTDIGSIEKRHVDLKKGTLDFPREKTGIERRCPLWPETIAALKVAIAERPEPKNKADADRIFLLASGTPWTSDARLFSDGSAADKPKIAPRVDEVTKAFRRLLNDLKLHKHGLGFYSLRHIFETIAGATRDQIAVNYVMGHSDGSMAAVYRERLDDDRLQAVADHVRAWLFGEETVR